MSNSGLTYQRVRIVVDNVMWEVPEAVSDEIERLKASHRAEWIEDRIGATSAEIDRLRAQLTKLVEAARVATSAKYWEEAMKSLSVLRAVLDKIEAGK